jgi:uncharacterized protein (DUF2236 family)
MTEERYAAAAEDLVERSAKAFVAAIPRQPQDDGYFGPASVTWRLATDLSAPVAGLRALLLQALHPLAMAGVDQHSDWRRDPAGRLAATSAYLATLTFGDRATADRAAAQVRRIHDHVRGTDPVTGRPYAAGDPALLLWVHATFVDSGLAAGRAFGTPPTDADADAYVRETRIYAELLGVPSASIPADQSSLAKYMESVLPELVSTPAAAESARYLLDPPGMDAAIADLWQELRDAVLAVLPAWALDRYEFTPPPALTTERGTEIRGALGMFDAVFLGEPGVLEARQRITLRMRG